MQTRAETQAFTKTQAKKILTHTLKKRKCYYSETYTVRQIYKCGRIFIRYCMIQGSVAWSLKQLYTRRACMHAGMSSGEKTGNE